jgi:hypothetical protein
MQLQALMGYAGLARRHFAMWFTSFIMDLSGTGEDAYLEVEVLAL